MPSETLSLFPSPSPKPVPKSCMKHSNRAVRTPSPVVSNSAWIDSEAPRGLALHFPAHEMNNLVIEPVQAHIKHSLFCKSEPPRSDSPMDSVKLEASQSPSPTPQSRKALSSQPVHIHANTTPTHHKTPPRSPPSQAAAQPGSPPVRHDAVNAVRKTSPPLPERNQRQESMKSIFPVYDHSLPLSQQHYYPAPDAPVMASQSSHRRRSSSATRPALKVATADSTEPQMANFSQLQALWSAATGHPVSNRVKKVRLAMHRETMNPSSENVALEIGFSSFYSFSRKALTTSRPEDASAEMLVRRHHPLKDFITPVAQVEIAQTQADEGKVLQKVATTIFPQTAALTALENAATSSQAVSIAEHDPRASSPQAAQLAFDAVAAAKKSEESQVICTQHTNQFGAPENHYKLCHPRLGQFDVKFKGSINLLGKARSPIQNRFSRTSGYEKISIHHPYALVDQATKAPPVLASLDITAGFLELDVAALKELDSAYIIDTVVCALMTIAFMESEASARDIEIKPRVFDAPPTLTKKGKRRDMEASPSFKQPSRVKSWRNSFKRNRSGLDKPLPPPPPNVQPPAKLPVVTRGLLKLLGFSFDAIVWLLSLGVKVLTKLVLGVGKMVSKA